MAREPEGDDAQPPVAAALETSVAAIVRWSTRGDVRRTLFSDEAEGLSTTDAWLLARVVEAGPVRLSDLADWQRVDKSTITAQVHRLERRGLVRRTVDPADGRAFLLTATRRGQALHDHVRSTARALLAGLIEDWPEADQRQLAGLMSALVARMEER
jgi:DNA-binding MarR family transcriptional regulator